MKLWMTVILSAFVLSCAHKPKDVLVTSAPPPEEIPVEPISNGSGIGNGSAMNVALKGYKQIKAAGVVHIVPDPSALHVEVMLEGMRPGPYKVNLNSSAKCKIANASHGRDIGELIADGKGTAKANFDINGLPASDVVGKKVIIYTKEKGRTKVAACGVIEKI